VVSALIERARAAGVELREKLAFEALDERDGRIAGARFAGGIRLDGDCVVAALGAWSASALPFAADWFRSVGMPVFHLRPDDPSQFAAERFPVFGADISTTGWYGFPLHAGVVKIANHGPGRAMHPSSPARVVTDEETAALRAFLADTFPSLAGAPIVNTRVCCYSDTWDGHFWIARDPERAGLVIATGGSGHAFKFAPELGGMIADAVEERAYRWEKKFRHRPDVRAVRNEEAARNT
jgi:glycine/D-amino acid oxidase-like deaminating enzyme